MHAVHAQLLAWGLVHRRQKQTLVQGVGQHDFFKPWGKIPLTPHGHESAMSLLAGTQQALVKTTQAASQQAVCYAVGLTFLN